MTAPSEDPESEPTFLESRERVERGPGRDAEVAFAAWYRVLVPRLVAFLIVGHGATRREAAECAHEALAQYWRRRGDVHYPSAWCRRAARSVFYQRTYDALESFAELPATGVPLYSPATDDRALDDDHRDTVLALVTQLPPQARKVTALILEGLSYMDVAAELDLAESTVRSHASRARVELAALHRSTRRRGKGDR